MNTFSNILHLGLQHQLPQPGVEAKTYVYVSGKDFDQG